MFCFSTAIGLGSLIILIVSSIVLSRKIALLKTQPPLEQAKEDWVDRQSKISIVIPTRNEEKKIASCLTALSQSKYPRFEVIVADDNSSDKTVATAKAFRQRLDLRVLTIQRDGIPQVVNNKSRVLWKAAQVASGSWLLFIDADVQLTEDALNRTLSYCKRHDKSAFSCGGIYPNQSLAVDILENFTYLITFLFMPLKAIYDPENPLNWVTGQYLFIDKATYFSIEGHQSVIGYTMDDLAIARLLKDKRIAYQYLPNSQIFFCRNYDNLNQALTAWSRMIAGGTPWLGKDLGSFCVLLASLLCLGLSPLLLLHHCCTSGNGNLTIPAILHLLVLVGILAFDLLNRISMKTRIYLFVFAPVAIWLNAFLYLKGCLARFLFKRITFKDNLLPIDPGLIR